MSEQLALVFKISYKAYLKKNKQKKKTKRFRNSIPTYLKFYTLYQYDRQKFRIMLNEWLESEEGKNRTIYTLLAKQKEILNECYIRGSDNEPLKDSDEKYILSEKRLQKVHALIYEKLLSIGAIKLLHSDKKPYELKNLMIYPEYQQAELKGTWDLSLKDRILIHYKLLWKLKEYCNDKKRP